MLLYTEKQLDIAYRIDCKARTNLSHPWLLREQFRPMYEGLLEAYMLAHNEGKVFTTEIPEYLIESVNDLLETTLTLDK
tara:strand:- start:99 stop:335 length:237 start_codon:yes stop_codon:yes gene_type:complete